MDLKTKIETALKEREKTNTLRSLKTSERLIDFCSNDYLGLARNKELKDSYLKVINDLYSEPLGSGGSRLLAGNNSYTEETEKSLASFFKAEKALIFNTGYVANLALFSSLPHRNDTVICDELIHSCIKDGIKLSNATKLSFKHNNVKDLEKKLKRVAGNKIVAIESIYSMDGDTAPIHEIIQICKENKAQLIIDEAHSVAILQNEGKGLCIQEGVDKDFIARVYTFGKGLGAHGACVVGSSQLIDYLINFARPFIYTTAMPVHSIALIKTSFDFMSRRPELRQRLNNNIKLFKTTLAVTFIESNSPIQAVLFPGNEAVKKACKNLQLKGFDVRPVIGPTVKKGTERIRVCIHAQNTPKEIINLANAIKDEIRQN